MPATGTVLVDIAAALNLWCVWRRRERSWLSILAMALLVPAALLITLVVVGEGLAGV